MTFTSTPITVKDSAAADKSIIAYNDGTSSAFAHPLLDTAGAIISPATAGKQDTGNTALTAIQSAVEGTLAVDGSGATQPVSATALPLPTGAATAANQATQSGKLDSLITNTAGLSTAANQATGNTSLATVATNTGNVDTNLGAKADTAAGSDTGTFSLIALVKRGLQSLTSIATNTTGLSTAANQSSGNTSLSTIATNTTGGATAANQATANTKLDTVIANTGAGGVSLTNTPTVTAGAYTTGMVAGGKITLTGAARISGGSGVIQTASLTKKTNLTAAYDVYFFHTDPSNSTFTDNSALALNVADLPFLIGVAHCTDLVSNGTPQTLQAANLGLPFKLATGTSLFAVAVIRGAETLASTSAIVLNVGILQD